VARESPLPDFELPASRSNGAHLTRIPVEFADPFLLVKHPNRKPAYGAAFGFFRRFSMSSVLARIGGLVLVAFGVGLFRADASTEPAEIQWNELAALIVGHHVSIPLAGGVVVEGDALSVRAQALMLDIGRTSDSRQYPKGQTAIPRASVTEVRLAEHRGSGGRILGTVVGALVGMVVGGEIAVHGPNSEAAGVSTFTASAVACTVAGYYAGKSADRHSRWLRIAPLPAAGVLPSSGILKSAEVPAGDTR
jgi:hypothetical protein